MTRIIRTKTNFTAGELAPDMLGRGDLSAWDNGAHALRNVFIHPTGGVSRRPGLRHLGPLPGNGRLIAFEFNTEQAYLLAVTAGQVTVFMDDASIANFDVPWNEDDIAQLNWTQNADTLLIAHPDHPPQQITRRSHSDWSCEDWSIPKDDDDVPKAPFSRIAASNVMLSVKVTSGKTVTVVSDKLYFTKKHEGGCISAGGRRIKLTEYISNNKMKGQLVGTGSTPSSNWTRRWTEIAFSQAAGWPVALTFHQNRLVIGGSRSLPNHLWMSRSGDFFNFDAGTGLDDQAIDFAILSDQVNAIRHVISGRHLQVFTTGAEWTVSGSPLTPSVAQARRHTRIGSLPQRSVPPQDVDGATLFVSANGQQLREFLFTDLEQAYQSTDLALLARHLLRDPTAMAYDPTRRMLHVTLADGTLASVTNFRRQQVTAWALQTTAGKILSVSVIASTVYVVVMRGGRFALERFDETLATDSALSGEHDTPKTVWSNLDHLQGREVTVKADGADAGRMRVSGGKVQLAKAARTIEAGLPFEHIIEPLPPLVGTADGRGPHLARLVRATFRVLKTQALNVDLGAGSLNIPMKRFGSQGVLDTPPPAFTGDVSARAIGWQRDATKPLWRIAQSTPYPCVLLSVTTDTKVID